MAVAALNGLRNWIAF